MNNNLVAERECVIRKDKKTNLQRFNSRSAQGGMNAAILVAIIAGLIILYIIFLPNAQRESLLDNQTSVSGSSGNILLRESIGPISSSYGLEGIKIIPDAYLIETTNAKEIAAFNPFIVKNGWFDKRAQTVDFDLDDPDNTDNAILSFTAKKMKGVLAIKLNGVIVFENELANANIEPVRLSSRILQRTNTLDFSVSGVGPKFWSTNEYSLENAKVIADITDTSRQQSANLFTISGSEFSAIDKATLRFIPYCSNVNQVGLLEVYVNSKKVFGSVPVCDSQYMQSIPKSALNDGENNIVFKTTKGSYSVEQIKLSLDFNQPALKTHYFRIEKADYGRIRDGKINAILSIKFADSRFQKRLRLDINGYTQTVDTSKPLFTKNINSWISEGNNYARLEPIDDVQVTELKIELS
jgi:hypothetical protein